MQEDELAHCLFTGGSDDAVSLIAESRKMVASTANTDLAIQQKASAEFKLSWSHYQVLMRISDKKMRNFMKLRLQGQWSVPQLRRQYNSSLYERLALSRNKEEVIKLANDGQVIEKPQDALKNPFVLEFLGMEEKAVYTESDLESAV